MSNLNEHLDRNHLLPLLHQTDISKEQIPTSALQESNLNVFNSFSKDHLFQYHSDVCYTTVQNRISKTGLDFGGRGEFNIRSNELIIPNSMYLRLYIPATSTDTSEEYVEQGSLGFSDYKVYYANEMISDMDVMSQVAFFYETASESERNVIEALTLCGTVQALRDGTGTSGTGVAMYLYIPIFTGIWQKGVRPDEQSHSVKYDTPLPFIRTHSDLRIEVNMKNVTDIYRINTGAGIPSISTVELVYNSVILNNLNHTEIKNSAVDIRKFTYIEELRETMLNGTTSTSVDLSSLNTQAYFMILKLITKANVDTNKNYLTPADTSIISEIKLEKSGKTLLRYENPKQENLILKDSLMKDLSPYSQNLIVFPFTFYFSQSINNLVSGYFNFANSNNIRLLITHTNPGADHYIQICVFSHSFSTFVDGIPKLKI